LQSAKPLLEVLVSRCIADLETKEIDLEFALPMWAMHREKRLLTTAGLVETTVASGVHQTISNGFILSRYTLTYHKEILSFKGQRAWYTRHRLPLPPLNTD
jgi:hypothetical protein